MSELQEAVTAAAHRGQTRVGDDLRVSPVLGPATADVRTDLSDRGAWRVVGQAAAALALAMGIGRFVFTPILPLMTADAGLSASGGAALATVNLVGYLAGAVIGIAVPQATRSRVVLRVSLVVLVVSLGLMAATDTFAVWAALRFAAGVASALLFVIAVAGLHAHLRERRAHLIGWGFGGVGAGIAASGALVLLVRETASSAAAWLTVTVLAAVLAAVAWTLRPAAPHASRTAGPLPEAKAAPMPAGRTRPWFVTVAVSYGIEGVGYIIAATFLVAAIEQQAPGWVGDGAWVLVGLAALPSTALWAWLTTRVTGPTLLASALAVQAAGIALVALVPGLAATLISAVMFGATVIAISTLALGISDHLRIARGVAILTTVYAIGQIIGPLVAAPLLDQGYTAALLLSAAVVIASAIAAGLLRIRYPHRPDQ